MHKETRNVCVRTKKGKEKASSLGVDQPFTILSSNDDLLYSPKLSFSPLRCNSKYEGSKSTNKLVKSGNELIKGMCKFNRSKFQIQVKEDKARSMDLAIEVTNDLNLDDLEPKMYLMEFLSETYR
ncbi:hypothetical protein ACH5RR_021339 [Cinchona calisaya]|uniref:Uncharacterized protein n=1 Tax=Cinchona calisaya TaxID=153742 RepID=A0ABD2ZH09_9GENT